MCILLITQRLWLVVSLLPVNWFKHISLMAFDALTDRPKSVRNRFAIEVFGGIVVLSIAF